MSKAKLEAARELIRSKQYAEARAVLRTMADDATARKWLARLDEIAPEQKPKRKRTRLAGVLALVVLCGVIALITPRQPRQPAATATSRVDASTLPAAAMPSRTPAPSLTITQTLTPSPTFTAAPSLTITQTVRRVWTATPETLLERQIAALPGIQQVTSVQFLSDGVYVGARVYSRYAIQVVAEAIYEVVSLQQSGGEFVAALDDRGYTSSFSRAANGRWYELSHHQQSGPQNCPTAIALELNTVDAAWYEWLDRDNDGLACEEFYLGG